MTDKDQSKRFLFTQNGIAEARAAFIASFLGEEYVPDEPEWDPEILSYLIYQLEQGKEGTFHWQGYCETHQRRTCGAMQKKWLPGAHFKIAHGTAEHNKNYVWKLGDKDDGTGRGGQKEFGTPMNQGKRKDLDRIKDELLTVPNSSPSQYFETMGLDTIAKYKNAMKAVKIARLRKAERDFQTDAVWCWGPTGTGKTHWIMEQLKDVPKSNRLFHSYDGEWWDDYDGQEYVVLDDFRGGQYEYNALLHLLDKWPHSVRQRNVGLVPWVAKKVFISAPYPPEEAYPGIMNTKDSIAQLIRRLSTDKAGKNRKKIIHFDVYSGKQEEKVNAPMTEKTSSSNTRITADNDATVEYELID